MGAHVEHLPLSRCQQAHPGDELVGAARQSPQGGLCRLVVGGLAQNQAVDAHHGIRGDNGHLRPQSQHGLPFPLGQCLHGLGGGELRRDGFVHPGDHHLKVHAGLL